MGYQVKASRVSSLGFKMKGEGLRVKGIKIDKT
jgi:hypothetical protein